MSGLPAQPPPSANPDDPDSMMPGWTNFNRNHTMCIGQDVDENSEIARRLRFGASADQKEPNDGSKTNDNSTDADKKEQKDDVKSKGTNTSTDEKEKKANEDVSQYGVGVQRHASKFASSYASGWFEKGFVDQFPYGRGGPSEPRRLRASLSTLLQHYPRLSTNMFLDYAFQLHAYDHKTREDMARRGFVQVNIRADNTERQGHKWGRMTGEQAVAASKHFEACAAAAKAGKKIPPMPDGVTQKHMDFMKSISLCLGEAQHTASFIEENRVKLFSMMARHGTPQWW